MELIYDSKIKGAFRGWKGNNIYPLINGMYWKQKNYKYSYHYAYRPKARIWQEGSTKFLEVEGMKEMVAVRRATSSEIEEFENEE